MDEKTARKLRLEQRKIALDCDDFVRAAVSTPQGRNYLWWLMGLGRAFSNPFAQNALAMSFNCGQMDISQRILEHILSVAPDGYFQILKEKQKDQPNDNADSDSSADYFGNSVGGPASSGGSAFE